MATYLVFSLLIGVVCQAVGWVVGDCFRALAVWRSERRR